MLNVDRLYRALRVDVTESHAAIAATAPDVSAVAPTPLAVCHRNRVSSRGCLEVHLVVQYYRPRPASQDVAAAEAAKERAVEIDWCLYQNLRNPWISHVHVLTESHEASCVENVLLASLVAL